MVISVPLCLYSLLLTVSDYNLCREREILVDYVIWLAQVSVSEANYVFTVRFYEFRNPLGLQCGECESGGPPACCDDVQRNENCNMTKPLTCDTRFRFLLRPFGAPVETAPNRGFPHFTPSNGDNTDTFNEGPGGFLALPNPFIINSTSKWMVSNYATDRQSESTDIFHSSHRERYSSSLMLWTE